MKKNCLLVLLCISTMPRTIISLDVTKEFNKFGKNMNEAAQDAFEGLNDAAYSAIDGASKLTNDALQGASDLSNSAVYYAGQPIEMLRKEIRKQYPMHEKWTDDELQVRLGQSLCQSELNFIKNRTPIVTQALKEHFDIDTPLNIALCLSGGGNRAMLVALGFLLEAQEIGLFDASLYMAGLSGSTWTICPFSYLHATKNLSLTNFHDQLISRLSSVMKVVKKGTPPIPVFGKYENTSMQNNMAKRFGYGQYLSSIDMYASFIGNYTLLPVGDNRLDVTWSSIADTVELGNMPLTMGSAVAYKTSNHGETEYYWFEVGPFEVGSDQINAYVPTQAFGSKFKNGRPVSGYAGHAPEYPISFYEGVFGSAFTLSINELVDRNPDLKFKLFGRTVSIPMKKLINNTIVESMRFSPATFHNFTHGLKGSPTSKNSKIKLYDAGMNFDFPLPLVMRPARQVDLVVVCDAMIDLESLKLAAIHFKRNHIKFPDISGYTEKMIAKPLTMLNDPRMPNYDKDMITIAYCPFVKNEQFSQSFDPVKCRAEGFCQVLNFNYTKKQAEQVVNLTRHNLKSVKDEIKAVLQALQKIKQANKPAIAQVAAVQPAANVPVVATK